MRTRETFRQKTLKQFGAACQVCGYNRCERALQFRHLDPATKREWNTTHPRPQNSASPAEVNAHPERFKLLCANCHFELHDAEDRVKKNLETCLMCGEQFSSKASRAVYGRGKFCGRDCQYKYRERMAAENIVNRIMEHTVQNGDCLEWTGVLNAGTCPAIKVKTERGTWADRSIVRIMYRHAFGDFPKSSNVKRTCNNIRCINPAHLRVAPWKKL